MINHLILKENIFGHIVFRNGEQSEKFHGPSCFHAAYFMSDMSRKGGLQLQLKYK